MGKTIRLTAGIVFAAGLALCLWNCAPTPSESEPKETTSLTYVFPPENGADQSRTPVFIWNAFREAEYRVGHYVIYVFRGSSEVAELEGIVNDTIFACPEQLDESTEYEWRVQAVDLNERKRIGPRWAFTTGSDSNNPPVVPYNPDPVDRASSTPLFAELGWECYDPDGDAVTYDVWLDTPFTDSVLVGSGLAGTSVDPGDLEPDKRYDWKVAAVDEHGKTTVGPWWTFKTITASNKPPVEPWGPYPSDDAANVACDVTLDWSCSDPEGDPITYDVAMGLAGGTLTVVGSDLTESSFAVSGLDPYTEYEWIVTATDDHQHTTPSPVWSFTTGDCSPVHEVFAALELGRSITYDGSVISRVDHIFARFDSVYAPAGPIHPMKPAGVSCGGFDLVWIEGTKEYSYTDYVAGYFLNPAQTYIFTVAEGGGVPALTSESIVFPACQPYITSPAPFSFVSMDGFDLEWHTFCSGTIDITIMDLNGDSTGVYIRTEDDGFYHFTADDLSVIPASAYQLQIVLINENRKQIAAPGYDPRGWIWARILSTQIVYKQM